MNVVKTMDSLTVGSKQRSPMLKSDVSVTWYHFGALAETSDGVVTLGRTVSLLHIQRRFFCLFLSCSELKFLVLRFGATVTAALQPIHRRAGTRENGS